MKTDAAYHERVLESDCRHRQKNRAKINERARVRYAADRQTILARRRELSEINRAARALIAMRKASLGRLGTRTLLGPWVTGPQNTGGDEKES